MDLNIVKHMVCNLDWNMPKETQDKAIEFLSNIDDEYFPLIFNENLKGTWENSVKVIKNIGFPKNKILIPKLLWLMQDVNWPGSLEAMQILTTIEIQELFPFLKAAIVTAYKNNDTMWLGGLKLVIEKANYDVNNLKDEKIFDLLKYADF